jgi:thiol-disulfide isomerase/thioredoxin
MIFATALRHAAGSVVAAALLFVSAVPGKALADDPRSSLDLAAYRGKVVVIDFWASWCAPCRRSFPWLEAMQRKYADQGLVVIGVNEDNVPEDAAAFLDEVPVSFRIVPDENGDIAREFELIAMPSTYIIGRDGKMAVRHPGFKTAKKDEYEALLKSLLETGAAAGESDE